MIALEVDLLMKYRSRVMAFKLKLAFFPFLFVPGSRSECYVGWRRCCWFHGGLPDRAVGCHVPGLPGRPDQRVRLRVPAAVPTETLAPA